MKFILLFSTFLSYLHVNAQNFKPFEGELMYSIELIHPETKKPKFISFTTIFTNDTLVRTDSENLSLGKQTLIRHLQLSKQYVLLEYKGKKYAIQQTISKDTTASKYHFTTCRGHKRFCGIKAKKIMVSHPNFKLPIAMYYAENIHPKYIGGYYIQSEDGLLCYTLQGIKEKEIPNSFFSVGKDYEIISFNEFIERISK
jgi:hypothetical protein